MQHKRKFTTSQSVFISVLEFISLCCMMDETGTSVAWSCFHKWGRSEARLWRQQDLSQQGSRKTVRVSDLWMRFVHFWSSTGCKNIWPQLTWGGIAGFCDLLTFLTMGRLAVFHLPLEKEQGTWVPAVM